ncbi:hypothetical protein DPMN_156370 [Dreissena polymorpha]|uniref:Uncharacterized protein n=1 Tax=Dreissena polymorpha TaxID=45954 RepID=A0A9D4FTG5_DREPO|nr:hypothetical protein DPMN_156370 [Dreissena polymorpha]
MPDFTEAANILAEPTGRALAGLLNQARQYMDLHLTSSRKLYETNAIPVMDYSSEVWGYKKNA